MFDSYHDIFSRRADSYHAAMAEAPDARDAEFAAAIAPLALKPGEVLCDLPAGGGYLRRWLPAGIFYLAIEPSDYFLRRCPEDATARRLQCEPEAIALPDACVDHVVSLAGLHHSRDLDAAFAEMRRILRPGGRAVIIDVEAGSATDRFLNGFVHAHNSMGHTGVFFDAATPGRLARVGLGVESDELVTVPWRFADTAAMAHFCKQLFGIDRADEPMIGDAIGDILGCTQDSHGIAMHWMLRRLTCTTA